MEPNNKIAEIVYENSVMDSEDPKTLINQISSNQNIENIEQIEERIEDINVNNTYEHNKKNMNSIIENIELYYKIIETIIPEKNEQQYFNINDIYYSKEQIIICLDFLKSIIGNVILKLERINDNNKYNQQKNLLLELYNNLIHLAIQKYNVTNFKFDELNPGINNITNKSNTNKSKTKYENDNNYSRNMESFYGIKEGDDKEKNDFVNKMKKKINETQNGTVENPLLTKQNKPMEKPIISSLPSKPNSPPLNKKPGISLSLKDDYKQEKKEGEMVGGKRNKTMKKCMKKQRKTNKTNKKNVKKSRKTKTRFRR